MELRQLAYFLAVVEEENFTRAGERMNVAQSGISQQVRRLERELGERLLDRSNKTVRLTEAGRAFLPHALAAVGAADSGRAALAELRGLVRGHLCLGAIQSLPGLDLAGLLSEFHESHPAVELTLREGQSDPLLSDLKRGDVDAVFVGLPGGQAPEGISVELLSVERLVLVTSADHRLSDRQRVSVDELCDEPLITFTRGSGARRHIENACRRAGFAPRIACEASDSTLLTDLAGHGLGVAIVPLSIAAAGATRRPLRTIDLSPQLPSRYTALAWRTSGPHSPAARAFVSLARKLLTMRQEEAGDAAEAISSRRRCASLSEGTVQLALATDDPRAEDVRALLERHLAFARKVTPPGHVHALDVESLVDPAVTLFSARRAGVLLGVGVLKELDPFHGELKSMHTVEAARGQGVGRAMVNHLLSVAAARSYRRVSLETGTMDAFAPARALYAKVGFKPCEPFGEYTANASSACMTIDLASPP